MSDELHISEDIEQEDIEQTDAAVDGDDFEEITSDEVDRVVTSLEQLIESVDSENIRTHLEDAMNGVYYLVYDEDDEAEDEGDVIAEAA